MGAANDRINSEFIGSAFMKSVQGGAYLHNMLHLVSLARSSDPKNVHILRYNRSERPCNKGKGVCSLS